ncbi:hypothetical protein JGH11_05635 [Dysgonomonas sp. Marseille-P4677]|uniref:hypothetical protein n=1 Tax=Dysgonomonas sp. Marseille-P4677 TaxID=2364790 RepID=UPI0019132511|nr:hypothetical protein [Dysgonomonas sp. Marseille-P4677]MBK5720346.1 hypothetical protein [Dysgonomonas sp. Marseille-P4677]
MADEIVNGFNNTRYIECAIKLLENNYNTESLYILAGLDCEDSLVLKKYFEKVLSELDVVPETDNEKLINIFALKTVRDVIDCRMTPDEGLANMVKIANLDYLNKYIEFIYISDDIYSIEHGGTPYYFPELSTDKIDELIKNEFFIFYEAERKGIYEKVKNYIYCKKCSSLQEPVLKKKRFRNIQYYACSNCGSDNIAYNSSSICTEKIIEFLKIN